MILLHFLIEKLKILKINNKNSTKINQSKAQNNYNNFIKNILKKISQLMEKL